jgi:lactate dehydrogenase-like 2-hydroxyacid dehydrogenase
MEEPRRPRVLVTRRIPDAGLAMLREATDVDLWEGDEPPPRDELLARVRGVDGLLSLLTERVDEELLDAAGPGLRVVANLAVGFDNVDVEACARRGIAVGNTPGVLTETTADLAWALMLAAARRLPEAERYVREGRWRTWDPLALLGPDIHGSTLGIVGFGRIGRAVARRAAGFGMRVVYHSRTRLDAADEREHGAAWLPLPELLAEADFVSLHVALTPETRHLIDAAALRSMKPTAVLVNTSRGPVVDTDALVDALRRGTIAAAALDVTDPEPLPAGHPLVGMDKCLVVPHIGSASPATRRRMAEMAASNLLAGLRGDRLPHPVNAQVDGSRASRAAGRSSAPEG